MYAETSAPFQFLAFRMLNFKFCFCILMGAFLVLRYDMINRFVQDIPYENEPNPSIA